MLQSCLTQIALVLLLAYWSACSGLIETGGKSSLGEKIEYKIRPGDVVEIRFQHYPDFNQTLIVSSQGTLSLRMIGVMHVTDLTQDIFKELIVEKYGQVLADPRLSVSVLQTSNYSVYINGEINNPGMLRIRGGLTITESIIMAGGLKDQSLDYQVIVLRNRGSGVKVHKFVIKKNERWKFSNGDFKLAPFDVIYIKKSSPSTTTSKKSTKLI